MSYTLTNNERMYLHNVISGIESYGSNGQDSYDIRWSIDGVSIDAAYDNSIEDSILVEVVESMLHNLENQEVSVLKNQILPFLITILRNLLDTEDSPTVAKK